MALKRVKNGLAALVYIQWSSVMSLPALVPLAGPPGFGPGVVRASTTLLKWVEGAIACRDAGIRRNRLFGS